MTPSAAITTHRSAATSDAGAVSTIAPKYDVTVWFDLDETLFIKPHFPAQENLCNTSPSLTRSSTLLFSKPCYLIFLQRTKELFHWLISEECKNRVRIGFITAGEYQAQEVLPFLETEYNLPYGTLQSCEFINAMDYGNKYTPKGEKLLTLCFSKFFNLRETIILVDDNPYHIKSATEQGFVGIRAHNDTNVMFFEPDYLDKVRVSVTYRLDRTRSHAKPKLG